jgi:hypothetical protein
MRRGRALDTSALVHAPHTRIIGGFQIMDGMHNSCDIAKDEIPNLAHRNRLELPFDLLFQAMVDITSGDATDIRVSLRSASPPKTVGLVGTSESSY